MQKVAVQLGQRSYPILISPQLFNQPLAEFLPQARQVVIVSNPVVAELYLPAVTALFPDSTVHSFILPDGEAYKTLTSFEQVMSFLLEHKINRDVLLVALGGGVIGDLTGFVAACYQRGVRFIQVPTTLLSQVDSSVGGKTAVNHPLGKNMIGAFKQPDLVLINTSVLGSLPATEFAAGMAEVIKYALISDLAFFHWLEQNQQAIRELDLAVVGEMIKHCCQMKADIVSRDETEQGERALLNLGHTFGHAIEAFLGYGQWLHGEAVAVGMVMASQLAMSRGQLSSAELQRIIRLLSAFGLPVAPPAQMKIADFMPYMKTDKKVQAGKMRFIIPTALGQSAITDDVTEQELMALFSI